MVVRELLTRLGFQVDNGRLRQYQQSTNNIRSSAEGAANAFRNMFVGFVGFSALKSLSNTADQMQSMEARIAQLPQTLGNSADAFDVVTGRASAARQSIEAYGNLYIKLQNAGKDYVKTQEEGLAIADTLSKALVVGGASAQEQSSAMLQFAQAIGSGVLQGDELRAMSEAAPQFLDELSKAIGVPRAELKKFASQGKLTSKLVIEGVKSMGAIFEEKFRKMPMTIGQATTIMGNKWDTFIARLNRKSHTVTIIATFLLDGFGALETKLNEIVGMLGGAEQAVKFFAIALAAIVAPAALWLIGGALAFMASSTMALMAGFLVLGLAIDDINGYLKGNESLTGDFIKFIKENIPYFTILGAAILGVAGYFTVMAAAAVVAWLAVAWPILLVIAAIAAVAAAVLTVEAYWGEMVAFFAGIWNSIVASASMAIEAVVNSFHQLKDWLTSIGSFIKQIWTAVWDEITASLLAKIDIMKGYWNNLKALFGAPIKAAIEAVSPAIAQARSNIVPFATGTQVQGGVGLNSFAPRQGRAQATNITVNQTLPPGTTAQTAEAAKSATIQALQPMDKLARQAGQAQ